MGGDQDARPSPREPVDQRHQTLDASLVDSRERLVEQQHLGVLDERARDQDALALAARELTEPRAASPPGPPRQRLERRSPLRASERRHHGTRVSVPISATSSALTG